MTLHSALSHLDNDNIYVRMLFIDFIFMLFSDLGSNTSLSNWILDFLTIRPQSVRLENHTSSTLILNTSVPQGCVLSPLRYSLCTYNCTPVHGSNTTVKFADGTIQFNSIQFSFIYIAPNYNNCHLKALK